MRSTFSVSLDDSLFNLNISDVTLGAFSKYLILQNMQVPPEFPKSDICKCGLTNYPSLHRPVHRL